jgi:V8-like Glu-specific endopeptidase
MRAGKQLSIVGGVLVLVGAVVAFAARSGSSGAWNFDQWRTGVGRVEILHCDGSPFTVSGHAVAGSGFLVGSRVVVTAEHGIWIGLGRPACKLRVRFGSTTYAVTSMRAWSNHGEPDRRGIDLATLTLARPVSGHLFAVSTKGVPRDSPIATLGYPLGGPLRITKGTLTKKLLDYGVPTLATTLAVEGGNSGGPILDESGAVLGVVSRVVISGSVTRDGNNRYGGIDLQRWWDGSAADDLCLTYPHGGIPDCSDTARRTRARVSIAVKRP